MAIVPAIIAPTFNNAGTLEAVLRGALQHGLRLFVVNDGSSDETADILQQLAEEFSEQIRVLTHAHNRGKAVALQTGFAAAADAHCTHAVTIDTDGQLDVRDIPVVLQAAARHPDAMIVGSRDESAHDYPSRSRLGRRLSNLAILLETGRRVSDSQCGLRVYPLKVFDLIRCRMGRYAFEAEVIARAAWAGCDIVDVSVRCRYFQGKQRISHFRPWRDSLHGLLLHMLLIGRALVPWPHRRMKADSSETAMPWSRQFWRGVLAWMNPVTLWRDLRQSGAGRSNQAVGVGVGVFIGCLPIYGLQTVTSVYVARRLHLHPLAAVAGTQVSTPPMGIVLIAAAVGLGHLVLRGSLPEFADYNLAQAEMLQVAGELFLEWLVGGTILGIVAGVLAYAVCYRLFSCVAINHHAAAAPVSEDSDTKIPLHVDESA